MVARRRAGLLTALTLVAVAVPAATSSATLMIQNYNDPAGDPMVAGYSFILPAPYAPIDFSLVDTEYRSFGPGPGTYTVQSRLPAGWRVADIQCIGPSPQDFAIDLAQGKVTITHGQGYSQTCAFTNRRVQASSGSPGGSGSPSGTGSPGGPGSPGSSAGSSPGVAPTPVPGEPGSVALPNRPALVKVVGGQRRAVATVRLVRRSVVRASLLWKGKRVVGATRVVRDPGTHAVTVRLTRAGRHTLLRQGQKRVTLTLRVVVAPQAGGATRVFTYGVLVQP